MKGYRGYISSREIGGQIIPQRVQNLVIRSYSQKKGLHFLLSATEYYMDDCYMMLRALMQELNAIAGIIFYSMELLPQAPQHRLAIYHQVLAAGCKLHFGLEELVIAKPEDIQLIEDILICRSLAATPEMSLEVG